MQVPTTEQVDTRERLDSDERRNINRQSTRFGVTAGLAGNPRLNFVFKISITVARIGASITETAI
jgi:hypothetical protein